jgi:polyferredoxin
LGLPAPHTRIAIRTKKVLQRRRVPSLIRNLRPVYQVSFAVLNVWIAVQFYFFVRQFELAEKPYTVGRPAGVEGWLPIAGLMNLKAFILTGRIPEIHPATMVLLATFLGLSILARKAFCSWLCPVGTISEWLWKAGRHIFGRNFRLPRWLDIPLRSLKYILLGLFAYVVVAMSVESIRAFLDSPYGIVADVKMLNFFRYLGTTGAVVLGILALASIFVQNFWCRYLCPYGALMGLAALASPLRIRRDPVLCIDCAKCAKACPSALPVDKLVQIRSAECLGCMECVNICPAEGALDMKAFRRRVPSWAIAAAVACVFLTAVGWAKASSHWNSQVPYSLYERLIPHAAEFEHPR